MEKKEFKLMVEQIRNFITHCIGLQPNDITGGEFSNRFVWKTNNSEFEIVALHDCSLKKDQDFFEYYLTIDGKRIDGSYYFGNRLTCEDENAIARIVQPFKKSIMADRKALKIVKNTHFMRLNKHLRAFKYRTANGEYYCTTKNHLKNDSWPVNIYKMILVYRHIVESNNSKMMTFNK